MKTSQSTLRRLALLASTSFSALGLVVLAGGAALTPAKAMAADECGVQAADGDPIVCAPGIYPTGITYSGGTVPVTVQDGVSVTDGGISLTGTTFVGLTAAVVTPDSGDLRIVNTAGAGLSLTGGSVNVDLTDNDSGDAPGSITGTSGVVATGDGLNLNFGNVAITGTDPDGYGVYATSVGGGGAFITATGDITSAGVGLRADFDGGYNSINLGNISGDQAALVVNSTMTGGWGYSQVNVNGATTGDVIASTVDGWLNVFTNAVTGNLQASSTGAGGIGLILKGPTVGNVDMNAGSGGGFVSLFGDGAYLIGDVTVTAQSGGSVSANLSGPVTGNVVVSAEGGGSASAGVGNISGTGTPIIVSSDTGDASVGIGGTVSGTSGYMAQVSAGGSVTVTIGAGVTASQSDFDISVGNHLTFNNWGGAWQGSIDFSMAPGGGTFYNGSTWNAAPITFTEASDALVNNGTMLVQDSIAYDFKGGADVFSNAAGLLIVGSTPGASTLSLQHLESFSNNGTIILGSTDGQNSDGEANDRIVADGAAYTGAYGSKLLLDVNFSGASQADCSAAVVADCISLVGGSADMSGGPTTIYVKDAGGSTGGLNKIVLVDVHGGTGDGQAFALPGVNLIQKGLFYYRLQYDAANQQYALVGYAGRDVYQFGQIATSAQNLWYSGAATWMDLNADAQSRSRGDGPAIWFKATKSDIDRANQISPAERSQLAPYNLGYTEDVKGYAGGVDILRRDGYVLGLMAGHQDADVDFKTSNSATKFKGENYGAYGNWTAGRFFVDGIAQLSDLKLAQTGDFLGGDAGKAKLKSTGGEVEAGARFSVRDGEVFVEPLVGLAYVKTKIDDVPLPGMGGVVRYDDPKSFRGSLGLRVSGASELMGGKISASATGRLWDEFEGGYKLAVLSAGNRLDLSDDFSGTFGELGVSVGYTLPNSRLSAFFNGGAKWKENYTDSTLALGVRMSW